MEKVFDISTYKKKLPVQAIDPETQTWTRAIATDVDVEGKQLKVTWPGYSKTYDCWIKIENIRAPVDKRPMITRNAIQPLHFPTRKEPRCLQNGDSIVDTGRNKKYAVEINDPFKAEVVTSCGIIVMYEYIREDIDDDDEEKETDEEEEKEIDDDEENEKNGDEESEKDGGEDEEEEQGEAISSFQVSDEEGNTLAEDANPDGELACLTKVFGGKQSTLPSTLNQAHEKLVQEKEALLEPIVISEDNTEFLDLLLDEDTSPVMSVLRLLLQETREIKKDLKTLIPLVTQNVEENKAFKTSLETVAMKTESIERMVKSKKRRHDEKSVIPPPATKIINQPSLPLLPLALNDSFTSYTDISQNIVNIPSSSAVSSIDDSIDLSTETIDISSSTPSTPMIKKRKRTSRTDNKCVKFIKKEMKDIYTAEELANSSYNGGVRKINKSNNVIEKKVLSPARLTKIMTKAKKNFREEFDLIKNMNEVVNSKCRKAAESLRTKEEKLKKLAVNSTNNT